MIFDIIPIKYDTNNEFRIDGKELYDECYPSD